MADANHHHRIHFLVVAYGVQGHLNPARELAHRLARMESSMLVTLTVTTSSHNRMFPSLASPDEEASDGLISYIPYSDGFDFGTRPKDADERARRRRESVVGISAVVCRLAATGRPVTFIVSTLSMAAVDVAREHGIPVAFYWIQPATVLAAYYHYFHGYDELIAVHVADPAYEVSLPGLGSLRIRDFPSFLVDTTSGSEFSKFTVQGFQEMFKYMSHEKPKVLVNTSEALEARALKAMQPYLEVFAVGPSVTSLRGRDATEARIHLFKQDEKSYMEWLGSRPARSVVYMSFGSLLTYSKRQVEEILQGLRECRRPYLWVVRKDGREEEVERCLVDGSKGDQGMVVEWCDQLEVLSHSSVGCFVTHCGWNSTLEGVVSGVPMVAVPNWSDQPTNAHLVDEEWGVGARAERDAEGILVGIELARCIELVMRPDERAAEMRTRAKVLKETVHQAVTVGGLIETHIRHFIKAMQTSNRVCQDYSTQPINTDAVEIAN